ncbi:NAD-dependent succinate-semialdehyde dehydrogenase [Pseudoalteromonas luteoviolacea]|uniref:NAD-dependent succinate-semialdehyde dehydrogenase n=1 Tax=Pseudoalteromonas luteoviolacea TaxID=43657 RepID=UPI001B36742B|nr:NAD-dependent succinate-semialdehyde dehydrogenase [Pseudoalteromonas luteoviolacea]MBQ4837387.1 NAD-dependent succinate-semialdehyde dehydrogenase [Pseudoalteromonas luteoviolacea]
MYLKGQTVCSIINGLDHQSDKLLAVHNPADGSLLAEVTQAGLVEADHALESAQSCFLELKSTTAQARSNTLYRWYQLILEKRSQLAEIITLEQGKPLKESLAEVTYAAGYVRWYAQQAERAYGTVIPANSQAHQLLTVKQGVGVVLGVTPWNFPLAMITRKVAPAYAAGCSFILKPSELTPISAIEVAKLALEAGMESGAFQVLVNAKPEQLVKHLTSKKEIRKLTFTGSTQVGKLLYAQCIDTMKHISLELGGNAPFIVFESADLDAAVDGLMAAKFRNAGQTCIAANRIFVHQAIRDKFLEKLKSRVSALIVSSGLEENYDIGPLITELAKDKAAQLIEDALSKGAYATYPAKVRDGSIMSPVILENVTSQMAIYHSEIFAPVVSIIEFSSESNVIDMANEVDAGLAAYFYSQDVKQIARVSQELDFAMIGINEGGISNPAAPFGGMKESGLGREGGVEGIEEYLETKYICQRTL